MPNPLVTVVIPTYNKEQTLKKSIQSVLDQDYSPIEIVIVDDGSTDNTSSILDELSDPRINVASHEVNKGANAARNTGITFSKGEWIAFLDSDDSWSTSKISRVIKLLSDEGNNYKVGYCGINQIRGGNIINTVIPSNSGNLLSKLLYKNIVGSFSVPVVHREVLEEVGGLDEALKSAQDWDLWLRIAEKGYLFGAIAEPLVDYLLPDAENHISNDLSAFIEGRERFMEKHSNLYTDQPKALSVVYRDMAFLLLRRFKNRKDARSYFLKSIAKNVLQAKAFKGLAGTCFPFEL